MDSKDLAFITLPKGAIKAVVKDKWSASFIVIVAGRNIKCTVYNDRPHKLFITYPSFLTEMDMNSDIESERSFYTVMGKVGHCAENIHSFLLSLLEKDEMTIEKVFIQE